MAQARSVRAVNRSNYSTEQEDEVSKTFIMCDDFGDDFCSREGGLKFLTHLESKTNQFEIVVKWLLSRL